MWLTRRVWKLVLTVHRDVLEWEVTFTFPLAIDAGGYILGSTSPTVHQPFYKTARRRTQTWVQKVLPKMVWEVVSQAPSPKDTLDAAPYRCSSLQSRSATLCSGSHTCSCNVKHGKDTHDKFYRRHEARYRV